MAECAAEASKQVRSLTSNKQVTLGRDGSIKVDGERVGLFQRLTIGGYEIQIAGLPLLGCHYREDIKVMVEANLHRLGS